MCQHGGVLGTRRERPVSIAGGALCCPFLRPCQPLSATRRRGSYTWPMSGR